VNPPSSHEKEDIDEAQRASQSWKEAYPDATVDAVGPHGIRITGDGFTTVIDLLAWGNVDHDGIEDVLFFLSHYATGGTFRFYHHAVLTRLDGESRWTMVDIEG